MMRACALNTGPRPVGWPTKYNTSREYVGRAYPCSRAVNRPAPAGRSPTGPLFGFAGLSLGDFRREAFRIMAAALHKGKRIFWLVGLSVLGTVIYNADGIGGAAGPTVELDCNTVFLVNGANSGGYLIRVSISPSRGLVGMDAFPEWGLLGGYHQVNITATKYSWTEPASGGHADISIDRNTGRFVGFVVTTLPFQINGKCSVGPAF